jgi:hypothetical protein
LSYSWWPSFLRTPKLAKGVKALVVSTLHGKFTTGRSIRTKIFDEMPLIICELHHIPVLRIEVKITLFFLDFKVLAFSLESVLGRHFF